LFLIATQPRSSALIVLGHAGQFSEIVFHARLRRRAPPWGSPHYNLAQRMGPSCDANHKMSLFGAPSSVVLVFLILVVERRGRDDRLRETGRPHRLGRTKTAFRNGRTRSFRWARATNSRAPNSSKNVCSRFACEGFSPFAHRDAPVMSGGCCAP